MIEKIKKYAGFASLIATAGVLSVPLLRGDDHITGFTQYESVDWEKADWKLYWNQKSVDRLAEKQAEALKRLKNDPFWHLLPKNLQQAIKKNQNRFVVDHYPGTIYLSNSNICVMYIDDVKSYYVSPSNWNMMTFVDAPQKTPAVDPKTDKPYVGFPPIANRLPQQERTYVKKLLAQINRNLHFLGSTPTPRLDPKRFERGEYLMGVVLPLTLIDLNKAFSPAMHKKFNYRSHEEMLTLFDLSDDIDLDIAKRLGAPLYHPERSQGNIRSDRGFSCYGIEYFRSQKQVGQALFLGWSRFTEADKKRVARAYEVLYQEYFYELKKSAILFRKGLEQELKALSKTDKKYPVIKTIVAQADKIAEKIERDAEQYRKQAGKIYQNPPHSVLDPTGTYLKKFMTRYKNTQNHQRQRD